MCRVVRQIVPGPLPAVRHSPVAAEIWAEAEVLPTPPVHTNAAPLDCRRVWAESLGQGAEDGPRSTGEDQRLGQSRGRPRGGAGPGTCHSEVRRPSLRQTRRVLGGSSGGPAAARSHEKPPRMRPLSHPAGCRCSGTRSPAYARRDSDTHAEMFLGAARQRRENRQTRFPSKTLACGHAARIGAYSGPLGPTVKLPTSLLVR